MQYDQHHVNNDDEQHEHDHHDDLRRHVYLGLRVVHRWLLLDAISVSTAVPFKRSLRLRVPQSELWGWQCRGVGNPYGLRHW